MAFNNLSDETAELLALLAEECGEVVQVIGKICRHGLLGAHPDAPHMPNYLLLRKEIGDVMAAVRLLEEDGVLDEEDCAAYRDEKLDKVQQYLHHSTIYLPKEPEMKKLHPLKNNPAFKGVLMELNAELLCIDVLRKKEEAQQAEILALLGRDSSLTQAIVNAAKNGEFSTTYTYRGWLSPGVAATITSYLQEQGFVATSTSRGSRHESTTNTIFDIRWEARQFPTLNHVFEEAKPDTTDGASS